MFDLSRIQTGLVLLTLGVGAMTTGFAAAQTLQPEIVVNEKAITGFEIDQRMRLLEAFGAAGNLRDLAIDQLTDDRLRFQAAETLGIELEEGAVDGGLETFAQARQLTPDQVGLALGGRGIALESLQEFIAAQLIWREVVQARFRAQASPSESDLDAALDFSSRSVQESVLLQEIAIPNEQRSPEVTLELGKRLSRELNRGGNFDAAARRYSRAASARRGGRLDWLPASALPPQIAGQVLALLPGEVSAAIPIPQGVTIIKLRDIREEPRTEDADNTLTIVYSQLIIPLPRDASPDAVEAAEAQAETIRAEAELCSDLDARAEEFGVGSGRSAPTPATDVPADVTLTLGALNVGEKAVQRDDRGVTLVMLCSRSGEVSPEAREALRTRLFNRRMNGFGQAYLQELRGDAVIETR